MQGIVSILGLESDGERTKATASLRRTLSADLSSKNWQAQHGFIPLKRVASSDQLFTSSSSSSSCSDSDDGKKLVGQFDIWSSIVAQKAKDEELAPEPYVHPLVKRSASSLTGKSLEICTESLGSESGSDGFSSCPSSEANSDHEDDKEADEKDEHLEIEPWVAKYNNLAASTKRVQPRAFPPPITSLGCSDGSCVRMKSHRDNGRVVLEAVSVPSQNNFMAKRQDGRLVLSFVGIDTTIEGVKLAVEEEDEEDTEQFEVEIGCRGGEDEQGDVVEGFEDDKKVGFAMEMETPRLSNGVIMHKLALMMKKPRVLANDMNPNWTNKFDDLMEEEMVVERMSPLTRSLPPRPPMARRTTTTTKAIIAAASTKATSSLNDYEYYWKAKSEAPTSVTSKVSGFSTVAKKSPSIFEIADNNSNSNSNNLVISKSYMAKERQHMMLLRGNNGDYLVPTINGCKDPRRSFSLREPHCIATS